MKYMEVPRPSGDGLCSDDSCPCGSPGATIPRGQGYIYVSKEVAEFREDCPTVVEAQAKIARMQSDLGETIVGASGVFAPILMCEMGARKRGINLEVAAADAKHWWETGMVPIRPTPTAGEESGPPRDSIFDEVTVTYRTWWGRMRTAKVTKIALAIGLAKRLRRETEAKLGRAISLQRVEQIENELNLDRFKGIWVMESLPVGYIDKELDPHMRTNFLEWLSTMVRARYVELGLQVVMREMGLPTDRTIVQPNEWLEKTSEHVTRAIENLVVNGTVQSGSKAEVILRSEVTSQLMDQVYRARSPAMARALKAFLGHLANMDPDQAVIQHRQAALEGKGRSPIPDEYIGREVEVQKKTAEFLDSLKLTESDLAANNLRKQDGNYFLRIDRRDSRKLFLSDPGRVRLCQFLKDNRDTFRVQGIEDPMTPEAFFATPEGKQWMKMANWTLRKLEACENVDFVVRGGRFVPADYRGDEAQLELIRSDPYEQLAAENEILGQLPEYKPSFGNLVRRLWRA